MKWSVERSHVVPCDDLREHVTNGDPCPCLPQLADAQTENDDVAAPIVVHNAYDRRERDELRKALTLWQRYATHLATCAKCAASRTHCQYGEAHREAAMLSGQAMKTYRHEPPRRGKE